MGAWWVGKGEKDGDIWSKWAGLATASASNLLKFIEKIALQKQCQAEETVAFEEVMMDFGSIELQAQKLGLAYTRSSYYSGSLPNVNQVGCGLAEFQGPFHSPLDSSWSTRHHGLVEQVQRDPRRMVSPLRRYARHISFTEGLRSLAGGGVGFLGSSWWEKGLEVLSSPILQKLLFPVSLKSDVWPFCQRWLL